MGGIRLKIHPLFFALGVYYALNGRLFEFIICTLTAVAHELGHSYAAARSGYKLDKMVLMPFGAVVKGNIDGLKLIDEAKIAFAGPLVNLVIGTCFLAVWWLIPEWYAFTDLAAQCNFSTALVNLIPAYPLDGGRVTSSLLALKLGKGKAFVISKCFGIAFAVVLLGLFGLSLLGTPNISLLFFASFVLFGAISRVKDNVYIKAYSTVTEQKLNRGMAIKRFAVSKDTPLKKIIGLLDDDAVNEVVVFDGENKIAQLSSLQISKLIEIGDIYAPIGKYVNK